MVAQTVRNSTCASLVLDDPSTVSSTAPNPVTDGNRGSTDPPSNSPTIDSQRPSLPTTLAPTPTATPTPESSGMYQVALYAVISVIVVFCAVIVTLAVTIVILYRRKGGHTNFKKTAG